MPKNEKKQKPRSDETKAFWRRLIDRITPGASAVKGERERTSEQIQRETGEGQRSGERATTSQHGDIVDAMIKERRRKRNADSQ